ncbi:MULTISPECIES: helix-turn-helix domain-containing protein [Streptomyces]|uniref:Putative DNA-binding protein n=1 Tax=Streptomyces venezuelae (strain ATCC 10712 / CBS 650.69 / DSM 40230 / JCM 4526 / NBRC 13096 / PD 04745) TaxID=953739 RepID=F2RAU5_STRVP|nr:helix-turn-helix transcriptional regulator [Streptomyces venezuelae]APE24684.1 transcriptional regulator [Streptomyces venezuelae]CCA59164.1 putative DNA-binding protein [Streptomyces venezuelae ATCC 10712]
MTDEVPKGSEPETSESLKAFGEVVKVFRKRAGLTQEQFAPQVGYSVPMIASIEQGRRLPSKEFVDRAEERLDAFGVIRAAAKHLTRRAGLAKWFEGLAELEPHAVTLYTYENRLVPGLFQTPAYARTLFEEQIPAMGDDKIESSLVARMERASLLTERPETIFSFIIEEHALRRQVGGPAVMGEQIDHALGLCGRRNIDVQVMPQSRGHHAGLGGPLRLLETEENSWYAYCEGQETGQLISDPKVVSILQQRYARMRAQALSPEESVSLLREIRGAL